jgi:ferritin-like metal-binding protein YciE
MALNSLDELMLKEIRDLYSAEKQLTKALPKMAKAAASKELRKAFESHLKETETHVERLESIFEELGKSSRGPKCAAMEGLVKEGAEILEEEGEAAVIDAALIGAAQRVEHYEIAGYGVARTFARLLGYDSIADTLQQTLDEEGAADKKLTKIAESEINIEAAEVAE